MEENQGEFQVRFCGMINKLVNVEATWTHSGPGGGTRRLHQKDIIMKLKLVKNRLKRWVTKRTYNMKLKLPCFLLVKNRKKRWIFRNNRVVVGPKYGYVFLTKGNYYE